VRDGVHRPVGENMHGWRHRPGDWIAYEFAEAEDLQSAVLILDSALDLDPAMSHWYALTAKKLTSPPSQMPHTFQLHVKEGGQWTLIARVTANHQRHVTVPVNRRVGGIRYTLEATWRPCDGSNLYGFFPVARG
jgi:hypothetical protein